MRISEYRGDAYIPPRHKPDAFSLAAYLQRVRPCVTSPEWPKAVPYQRGDAIQVSPSGRYLSADEVRTLIAEFKAAVATP